MASIRRFDPLQRRLEELWEPPNAAAQIEGMSLAASGAPGEARRLLVADSSTSLVQIVEVNQAPSSPPAWRQSSYIEGAVARFHQAIVLPGGRVAVAASWAALGVDGVDLFSVASPEPGEAPMRRRLASSATGDRAAVEEIVQPALSGLREIMAIDADTLLVTTASSLFAMTLQEGEIMWSIQISEEPLLSGEFAGARITPSGRLIAATFEPGRWVEPHPSHRVHWFEAPGADSPDQAPAWLARSAPLERAPRRVASLESVGASGTFGFEAGLNPGGPAGDDDVGLLRVTGPIALKDDVVFGTAPLQASVTFENPLEDRAVTPRQFALRAVPDGACRTGFHPNRVLITSPMQTTIEAQGAYTLAGEATLSAELPRGAWCLFPSIAREDGSWRDIMDAAVTFTLLNEDGSGGASVPREELPYEEFDPDDLSDDEPGPPDLGHGGDLEQELPAQPGGCGGCSAASGQLGAPSWPLAALLLLVFGSQRARSRFIR